DYVQRLLLAADLDSSALANREMDDAAVATDHPPVHIDNISRRLGLGPKPLHQARIIAIRHEADILAVGLGRDLQSNLRGDAPNLVLGQIAKRETQEVELLAGRTVKEIAL